MGYLKLRTVELKERYSTPSGGSASVALHPDNTALLTVKDATGAVITEKRYSSRKGAVIAMGRLCGRCKFIIMEQTIRKERFGCHTY